MKIIGNEIDMEKEDFFLSYVGIERSGGILPARGAP